MSEPQVCIGRWDDMLDEWVDVEPASVSEVVAALIAEGGEMRLARTRSVKPAGLLRYIKVRKSGRYLVFPIPTEDNA